MVQRVWFGDRRRRDPVVSPRTALGTLSGLLATVGLLGAALLPYYDGGRLADLAEQLLGLGLLGCGGLVYLVRATDRKGQGGG